MLTNYQHKYGNTPLPQEKSTGISAQLFDNWMHMTTRLLVIQRSATSAQGYYIHHGSKMGKHQGEVASVRLFSSTYRTASDDYLTGQKTMTPTTRTQYGATET